jgi:hypothetical protein
LSQVLGLVALSIRGAIKSGFPRRTLLGSSGNRATIPLV